MKKTLRTVVCFIIFALATQAARAQERTVSGRVTSSEDGSSLPGVNVVLKGSSMGAVTDAQGNYTLSIPQDGSILVFSFIGLQTREIPIGEKTTLNVAMITDIRQLTEVVVTAQNIERDERSLGYSVQSVSSQKMSQRPETNLLNLLQGQMAGINITGSSGAPGASTNINIRGITSFSGSNQPLFVVDGIVFSNDLNNSQNTLYSSQPSSRISDIAPDNIESVSVLAGASAAALYGSRASAGVIIITTKSAKNLKDKTEVTFTSSANFQNIYGIPKLQNSYGQGANNDFVNNSGNSWGPKFGGALTEVTTVQGTVVPYQAYPDNLKDGFFRTGKILQNNLNVMSGNADNNFTINVSNTDQDGISPHAYFKRTNIQFGGNKKIGKSLLLSSSMTYANSSQLSIIAGNSGSAFGQFTRIPRSYDLAGLPYKDPASGKSIYYSTGGQNNPRWSFDNEQLRGNVERVFGYLKVDYNIAKWLTVAYRLTGDTFYDRRKLFQNITSQRATAGNIFLDNYYRSEYNGDLMITASRSSFLLEKLGLDVLLGQNINQRTNQNSFVQSQSLTLFGYENPNNGSVFSGSGETNTRRRLLGYYGQVRLSYSNYLFLELTGRADQSSTLPAKNNTYFYPSAALSFVLSDFLKVQSDILSYAKLRTSMGKVGRDADPYLLKSVYVSSTLGNNSGSITFPITVSGGSLPGFKPSTRIGSDQLTPEFVTSYDGGINLGLFQNKLTLDVEYSYSEAKNQIFNVSVSNSSGFDTRTTNVGLMTNKQWAFLLNATPVRLPSFTWDVSFNYTHLRNKVVRIAEGIESTTITGDGFTGISASIAKGQPYGVVIGTQFARSPDGQLLVNGNTGNFVPGVPNKVLGGPLPDWQAGITNTFSYKGVSLSVLFDTRQGGNIYTFGIQDLVGTGSLEMTGENRETPRILPGVISNNDATPENPAGTFRPNNIQISAQTYWGQLGGLASEAAVYEATVYRLRDLSLWYKLPSSFFVKTPIKSLSIGFSGRNLWFFAPHFPGDPEVNTQGAGNIQGLDLNGPLNTRNYGANLKVTF